MAMTSTEPKNSCCEHCVLPHLTMDDHIPCPAHPPTEPKKEWEKPEVRKYINAWKAKKSRKFLTAVEKAAGVIAVGMAVDILRTYEETKKRL